MPVYLNSDPYREIAMRATRAGDNSGHEFRHTAPTYIRVGLVNNMPDGALAATERQFLRILESASPGFVVCLSLYSLPDLPRGEVGRSHIERFYSSVEELWDDQLDGLIVTGTEPKASNLEDEPYWDSFCRVLEWADQNTYSSVWSCLAAHGALLKTDGILRRRLPEKRFGLFDCRQTSSHPLTSYAPASFRVPHSRWNDIDERDLAECGYQILTQLCDGGVDSFVKRRESLLVFFQGHPEYEGDSILLEYRRDVRRFLRGERDTYPALPRSYFNASASREFAALEGRAAFDRREEVLAQFANASEINVSNTWHRAGARLYQNWLMYLGARKEQRTNDLRSRKMSVRTAPHRRRIASAAAD